MQKSTIRKKAKHECRKKEKRKAEQKRQQSAAHNQTGDYKGKDLALFERIKLLFIQYSPIDIYLAISASDLWLPNISSQIRHRLLYRILTTIESQEYKNTINIKTYTEFTEFMSNLHGLMTLLSMPTAEDYIPECDWGEISYFTSGQHLKIFYGNDLETTHDYITAFFMEHQNNSRAIADMQIVLKVQDYVINNIDGTCQNEYLDKISPGHLEIPPESFWKECTCILDDIPSYIDTLPQLSPDLSIESGQMSMPKSLSDFFYEHQCGTGLPFISIVIDRKLYPISTRQLVGAVIDHWSSKNTHPDCKNNIADNIHNFLKNRFSDRSIPIGPFKLVINDSILPHQFCCALEDQHSLYFLLLVEQKDSQRVHIIINEICRLLNNEDFRIILDGSDSMVEIPAKFTHLINLLVVFSTTTLVPFVYEKPEHFDGLILQMVDFIIIFDTLKDIKELTEFLVFLKAKKNRVFSFITSDTQVYVGFQSYAEPLYCGSTISDMVIFDSHCVASWRYNHLSGVSIKTPPSFPNDTPSMWTIKEKKGNIFFLQARNCDMLSYSVIILDCMLHFVISVDNFNEYKKYRILDSLAQCIADSANSRMAIISGSQIFSATKSLTTVLYIHEPKISEGVFSQRACDLNNFFHEGALHLNSNLSHVINASLNSCNSSFEVVILKEWLSIAYDHLTLKHESSIVAELDETIHWKPRFAYNEVVMPFTTPKNTHPLAPSRRSFIEAKGELEASLNAEPIVPGRYQGPDAKEQIDIMRNKFREHIHSVAAQYNKHDLIKFCIKQCDQLLVEDWQNSEAGKLTSSHEIDYDIVDSMSTAQSDFTRDYRCYRYLLEHTIGNDKDIGTIAKFDDENIMLLIAKVDYLLSLYEASDKIHNGVENLDIIISETMFPELRYPSDSTVAQYAYYTNRLARYLGIGTTPDDTLIHAKFSCEFLFALLDDPLKQDAGFSLSSFGNVLATLAHWGDFNGGDGYSFIYESSIGNLISVLQTIKLGISPEEACNVINFLTIDPHKIKQLVGKDRVEDDVPIWEHNKRDHRYMIRPLIQINNDVCWGAANIYTALKIWIYALRSGYLPADFKWPHVKSALGGIKKGLEDELVTKVAKICERFFTYVESEIYPHKRDKKRGFQDVGDYDVIAYNPETNHWISIECKYNRPVSCWKDARRLRDEIFGKEPDKDKGQLGKIENRRVFLHQNYPVMADMLGWPQPANGLDLKYTELYVGKDTSLWMYQKPYKVETEFVAVDALNTFLESLLSTSAPQERP